MKATESFSFPDCIIKDSRLFEMIYVLGTASNLIMEEPLQMFGKSDCLKGKSDIYRYHYQYLIVL